jgi:hypothetical protein
MTFIGLTFGVAALVLFILAFSLVAKGKLGNAVAVGVVAVILSGIAGGLVYAD